MKYLFTITVFLLAAATLWGQADKEYNEDLDFAQVREVRVVETSQNSYTFHVTVRHRDQGWDHYANHWQVMDPENGKIIATRILAHPHDNEQPFTRSKSGIIIPADIERVLVRAGCTDHGYEGKQVAVDLSEPDGDDYTIER